MKFVTFLLGKTQLEIIQVDTIKTFFQMLKVFLLLTFLGTEGSNNKKLKSQYNLDLEKKLDKSLINKFDVVFNHTTLEHIYDVELAIKNLSLMTKDIVIVVVSFIQEQHFDKKGVFTGLLEIHSNDFMQII